MNETLFGGIVDKFFRLVIGKITEKINGKKGEQVLLHKTMLTEEYSADHTWGSTEINQSVVAADVVSTNSSLPLKSRGSMGRAVGKIPKIGIKYSKDEDDIDGINIMIARGTNEATVASKIFDDASKVIKAIDIRKEIMFQQGLSTGITLVKDDDHNDGTGIRVDFGYKQDHSFVAINGKWGTSGATPQDDIQQLFDKAQEDGNSINHVYISKKYFNLFRKSEQGRMLAANHKEQVVVNPSLLAVPSRSVFLEALSDEYGATFHIVDSAFKVQKHNGKTESVRPWEEANIVGVPAEQVGRLVYGTLAEETNPVASVKYQKSGTHILVSKYSKTDPLEEFTAGQALAIPVIDGADGIYLLHADQEQEKTLTVDPAEVTYTASSYTKSVDVKYNGDLSGLIADSSVDWATVTVEGGKAKIKVSANETTSERSGEITISDGNITASIGITQSGAAA